MCIVNLRNGTKAIIKYLNGSENVRKRLIELGLIPGAEIKILENYGNGPIVIEIYQNKLMIAREMAKKIEVQ